jgi:hypothetical protein
MGGVQTKTNNLGMDEWRLVGACCRLSQDLIRNQETRKQRREAWVGQQRQLSWIQEAEKEGLIDDGYWNRAFEEWEQRQERR